MSSVNFESALAELETLVQNLESGKLTLESALQSYQRGAELVRFCQKTLLDAEQKIQVVENNLLQDYAPHEDPHEGPSQVRHGAPREPKT